MVDKINEAAEAAAEAAAKKAEIESKIAELEQILQKKDSLVAEKKSTEAVAQQASMLLQQQTKREFGDYRQESLKHKKRLDAFKAIDAKGGIRNSPIPIEIDRPIQVEQTPPEDVLYKKVPIDLEPTAMEVADTVSSRWSKLFIPLRRLFEKQTESQVTPVKLESAIAGGVKVRPAVGQDSYVPIINHRVQEMFADISDWTADLNYTITREKGDIFKEDVIQEAIGFLRWQLEHYFKEPQTYEDGQEVDVFEYAENQLTGFIFNLINTLSVPANFDDTVTNKKERKPWDYTSLTDYYFQRMTDVLGKDNMEGVSEIDPKLIMDIFSIIMVEDYIRLSEEEINTIESKIGKFGFGMLTSHIERDLVVKPLIVDAIERNDIGDKPPVKPIESQELSHLKDKVDYLNKVAQGAATNMEIHYTLNCLRKGETDWSGIESQITDLNEQLTSKAL